MESNNCPHCNGITNSADTTTIDAFDDADKTKSLERIYAQIVTSTNLDRDVYIKTADKLIEGVLNGFGTINLSYNHEDQVMLRYLKTNVYKFSAAKQYHSTSEMENLLHDKFIKDDHIVPFNEFKKGAGKIFDKYNERYLKAEYDDAIAKAQSASQWVEIEHNKDTYPNLEYVTARDGRVRPAHRLLDKIIQPVNSKFWSIYMPPNGWNCRCTALQVDSDGVLTDLSTRKAPTMKEVPEIFRFNAGKEKRIYSEKHPYFRLDEEAQKAVDKLTKNI